MTNIEQFTKYLESQKDREATVLPTEYACFDEKLCYHGFHSGFLCSILGKSGTGKTSFLLNWIFKLLNAKRRVLFFSMEMASNLIYDKLLQMILEMSLEDLYAYTNDSHTNIMECLDRMGFFNNFFIYDRKYHVREIDAIVKEIKPDYLMVDYLQLLKTTKKDIFDKTEDWMYTLLDVSKTNNTRTVVLTQMKRGKDEGHYSRKAPGAVCPLLDDARGGSVIEDACDLILGIWRPDLDVNSKQIEKNKTFGVFIKNRFSSMKNNSVMIWNFDKATGILNDSY